MTMFSFIMLEASFCAWLTANRTSFGTSIRLRD